MSIVERAVWPGAMRVMWVRRLGSWVGDPTGPLMQVREPGGTRELWPSRADLVAALSARSLRVKSNGLVVPRILSR
mgnify:CR=1 FL=1